MDFIALRGRLAVDVAELMDYATFIIDVHHPTDWQPTGHNVASIERGYQLPIVKLFGILTRPGYARIIRYDDTEIKLVVVAIFLRPTGPYRRASRQSGQY